LEAIAAKQHKIGETDNIPNCMPGYVREHQRAHLASPTKYQGGFTKFTSLNEVLINSNSDGNDIRLHQYQLLNYIRLIRNKKSFDITPHSTKWHPQKATSNETRDPPTTQASCAIARSSRLQVASRARRTGAAKIR
jgi:hypothetical protein